MTAQGAQRVDHCQIVSMASFAFRCTAFVGITIDGFIARLDRSIDYLPPAPSSSSHEHPVCSVPTISDMLGTYLGSPTRNYQLCDDDLEWWTDHRLANTDVLILGRHTYDTVLGFGEDRWPYGDKPVLVLSTQPRERLQLRDGVKPVTSIDEALRIVHDQSFTDVWVDGGATIRAFLREQLITEMILTTVPIALGDGLPLFKGIETEIKFEIVAGDILGDLLTTKYRVVYMS